MKTAFLVLRWLIILIITQVITFNFIGKNLIKYLDLNINTEAIKPTDSVEIRDGYYPPFHCHMGDFTEYRSMGLSTQNISRLLDMEEGQLVLYRCSSICYLGDISTKSNTTLSFHAEMGSWREWLDFFRISISHRQYSADYNHSTQTKYFWLLFIWIKYDTTNIK